MPSKNGANSLSTGAKVGIGVGAAVGTMLGALGAAAFIMIHRRRKRRQAMAVSEEKTPGMQQMHDLSHGGMGLREMPTNNPLPSEADSRSPASELYGRTRAELQ